jgi:hypothetical protein
MTISVAEKWMISELFHITPTANVDSILSWGLLSMSEMQLKGIKPIEFASTRASRDDDRDLLDSGFVYLCLHPGAKMFWRVVDEGRCGPLSLLEIDLRVLETPVAVFSDRPSNRRKPLNGKPIRHRRFDLHEPAADHLLFMERKDPHYLRYSEVLVPQRIDPRLIVRVTPWQRDQYSYQSWRYRSGVQ